MAYLFLSMPMVWRKKVAQSKIASTGAYQLKVVYFKIPLTAVASVDLAPFVVGFFFDCAFSFFTFLLASVANPLSAMPGSIERKQQHNCTIRLQVTFLNKSIYIKGTLNYSRHLLH